jgi:hypothetical protein
MDKSLQQDFKIFLNLPFKVKSDYEYLHISVYQVRDMFLYFVKYNDQIISDFAFELSEQDRQIKFAVTKCLS